MLQNESTGSGGSRTADVAPAWLLITLTTLPPISINMFLPSLPSIAADFSTSETVVQLGVTLFLFAFAAAHLVLGPASDRYGRRPALLTGLALFVGGSVTVLTATGPALFVGGRIIQGLGAASGPALGRAIIIDLCGREGSTRLLAYATVATALAPMVAPVIGGLLEELVGWRSVFGVLLVFSITLLAMSAARIPESNADPDHEALRPRVMASNYLQLLRSRRFMAYAILLGLLFAGQVAFLATSSFILIDVMGLSPTVYGVSFMSIAAGVALGAILASRLADVRSSTAVVVVGAGIAALATCIMAGIGIIGSLGVTAILIPIFLRAFGSGLLRPAAMAGAIHPFRDKAGLASAVLGFSQMGIGSLYGIAAGAVVGTNADSLGVAVALPTLIGFVVLVILLPKRRSMPTARSVTR